MRRLIIVIGLWLVFGLVLVGYTVPELSPPRILSGNPCQELYEDLLYPSVRITTPQGVGSGVFLKLDAGSLKLESNIQPLTSVWILTAAHVVGDEAEVKVEVGSWNLEVNTITATVAITDTVKDLALLVINSSNIQHLTSNLRKARLAPRDYTPYIFTPVWVVGCSLGFPPRPSEGIITAISDNAWEMNAPIVPGNSGGGVFLKDTHELIGIAIWVRTYKGQLITTMAGIVPLQDIYEFLKKSPEGVPRMGDQVSNCWWISGWRGTSQPRGTVHQP